MSSIPNAIPGPSLVGWWTCCGGDNKDCGREVNSALYQNTCPQCSHERCDSCRPAKAPSPVRDEHVHQPQYAPKYHPLGHPGGPPEAYCQQQYCANFETLEYNLPLGEVCLQYSADNYSPQECSGRRRPSMRGWWRCCQCSANNNPQVVGSWCPECEHGKCADCYVYQR